MPIFDKTTNIKASDLNAIRGTTGAQISLGNVNTTWYGSTSSNVSLGRDFVSTFANTQLSTVKDSVLNTADPNDWYHRGLTCGGDDATISGDGNRMAVALDGVGVYIYTRSGINWTLDTLYPVDSANTGQSASCMSVTLNYDGTTCAFAAMYYMISAVGSSVPNVPGRVVMLKKTGSTWAREAAMHPTGYTIHSTFGTILESGYGLALSADGNTLAVPARLDNGTRNPNTTGTSEGAIYIFVRSGSTWSQQTRLTSAARYGTLVASYDQKLGYSGVGISADGNTVVAGGPYDSAVQGALVVWTRSGTTWSQQVRLESDGTSAGQGYFWGWSTALSPDGNTMIASNNDYGNSVYRAWVYTRSGSTWTKRQDINLSSYGINSYYPPLQLGYNGDILTINDKLANTHVFTRSGTTWTRQSQVTNPNFGGTLQMGRDQMTNTASLLAQTVGSTFGGVVTYSLSGSTYTQSGTELYTKPGNNRTSSAVTRPFVNSTGDVYGLSTYRPYGALVRLANTELRFTDTTEVFAQNTSTRKFSTALTMSSDFKYMAVGNQSVANNIGALTGSVTVYANTTGTWTEQAYIQPQDVKGGNIVGIGNNLQISPDGTTLLISAQQDATGAVNGGSVYVYKRSGSSWSQLQKITSTVAQAQFGQSLASSSNGSTIVIGSYQENASNGSIRVYTSSGSTYTLEQTIASVKIGTTSTQPSYFGYSAALSGDGNTMAVGAMYDMPAGQTPVTYSGLVHIYTRTAGVWTRKVSLSPSPILGLYWGQQPIKLSGDGYLLAIPSAVGKTVTIFKRNTLAGDSWTQTHTVAASDTANNAAFGTYVGIDKSFTKLAVTGTSGVWVFK